MKTKLFFIFWMFVLVGRSYGQYWNLNSNSIYNTNLLNVGIGHTTPVYRLDVAGFNSAVFRIQNYTASGDKSTVFEMAPATLSQNWKMIVGSTGNLQSITQGQLYFENAIGIPVFALHQSGNIGIGTSTPASRLDISSAVPNLLQIRNTATSGDRSAILDIGSLVSGHKWRIGMGSTGNGFGLAGGELYFENASSLPKFVISQSGNIGIGTTSPSSRVDISIPLTASPVTGIYIQGNGFTNTTNALASSFIRVNEGTTEFFRLDGTGRMFIGNVPINANYATSVYRLFVDDGILTEKVKVAISSTSDWSDYVFEKDYNLMPLDSVEQFIDSNGHLPNVPSAQCVVSEGIDLGKMDATLLQKIEELTLYVIDLNKEIIRLKEELNQVKSK